MILPKKGGDGVVYSRHNGSMALFIFGLISPRCICTEQGHSQLQGRPSVTSSQTPISPTLPSSPRSTIQGQKMAAHSAVSAGIHLKAMANCLSPFCLKRKPPRIMCPKTPLDHPACRFSKHCMCITYAGFKDIPKTTPCHVCGALIPFSVCDKLATGNVPTLCFECKSIFA